MKLKKIVSLAAAALMAVSMLTACGSNETDKGEDEGTVVTPVDDSFATAINNELNTAQKNTLTLTASATLESALNKVSDKIDSDTLELSLANVVTGGGARVGFMLDGQCSDAQDIRHLMGLDDDASLTATGDNSIAPYGSQGAWSYFTVVDSAKTTLDLIVVDGDYTEEGLAHEVADTLVALMTEHRMPGEGTLANGDKYDYKYTGNIASVKIDNLRGDNSYYVVALEITQTPTKVVNAQG